MPRIEGQAAQDSRRAQDNMRSSLYLRQTETAEVVRQNTFDTTTIPSVVADDTTTPAPSSSPLSTGLVIQILVAITILFGATIFFLRRRRRRREHELHKRKYENAFEIKQISTPNGLGCNGGHIPPTYPEAMRSPAFSGKSDDAKVMDECMRAVYDAENALGVPPAAAAPAAASHMGAGPPEPTSPRDVRHSVSRWLRSQRWLPGGGGGAAATGPLSSNPPRSPAYAGGGAGLPVPPTPTYRGVLPATPSAPQTPWSATHLMPYPEPLRSATRRSTNTTTTTTTTTSSLSSSAGGYYYEDERLSIRASIPSSVLYPSPLQPAPPPRRQQQQQEGRRSRDSAAPGEGLRLYPADTWRTMTPHEDPPGYEPRRGDPDKVSPL